MLLTGAMQEGKQMHEFVKVFCKLVNIWPISPADSVNTYRYCY